MVTYIRYCFSSLTGSIQVSILCLSRSCHGRRVGGGERGEGDCRRHGGQSWPGGDGG